MDNFVHLHVHSEYSLLDGACRIKDLVRRIKDLGQKACAITDHGNMFAAVEFYNECLSQDIKPIIGCEVYVAPRTRLDKVPKIDSKPYHLILLCENNKGYQNLIKIVSMSYTEGFYNKPRIDIELLEKYHEGLICLSACLAGEISSKISIGNYEGAKQTVLKYKSIFGEDNYYLELQNHKFIDEERIVPLIVRLSKETGVQLVATNDVHYIEKGDAQSQQVLMCISTATTLDDPKKMKFPTDEFYLKSKLEMEELYSSSFWSDAIKNTEKIAKCCNVTFEFGKTKLPYFHIDGVNDNEKFLREMCKEGLFKRYKTPSDEAINRLEYELSIITKMGYTDYYLIVWDFIRYAKSCDIPVGCGRGSGAGSLCAYCIGITGVDPLKYNLLFERFLNPERVSMPDFDIDFCIEGRQKVIEYVINKYGSDHVAQIITFGTLGAKAAVRDVARVLGLSYQIGDKVAKLIPRGIQLKEALETVTEIKQIYNGYDKIRNLIDMAIKIEGMPRNISTHAAGVVITKEPVDNYVPIYARDELVSTQYTMTVLERLGLLKIDFLGLRNLTIIKHCQDAVRKKYKNFTIDDIPLNDKKVYDLFSEGKTVGIFQFESKGMTSVIKSLKPTNIEDLIAVISLYRPGPMDSIPMYIKNRHDPSLVTYRHPLLKEILEVTYGCIVYQEQVMQIFRTLAGYSYGRADIVRRAMAKKKHDVLKNERKAFIYGEKGECEGCICRGVPENIANEIFDEMLSFASYAFNKSHAAAYATIAYQTAYLKCHFFKEYMSALMSNALFESSEKLNVYINACQENGVKILPLDINKSGRNFLAEENGIRFSLLAVKGLGESAVLSIVKERNSKGNFVSLQDFCTRMSGKEVTVRSVEQLIKSGAMDCFKNNRHEMMNVYESLMTASGQHNRSVLDGQIGFFDICKKKVPEKKIPKCDEYSINDLLRYEREAIGMYITGHPLDQYLCIVQAGKCKSISEIESEFGKKTNNIKDGDTVEMLVCINDIKRIKTKNGKEMCFIECEDKTSSIEIVVFSSLYQTSITLIKEFECIHVIGKLSYKDDEEKPKIIAELIEKSDLYAERILKRNFCIRINSYETEKIRKIKEVIQENKSENGQIIKFYFDDKKLTTSLKNISGINLTHDVLKQIQEIAGIKNVLFM